MEFKRRAGSAHRHTAIYLGKQASLGLGRLPIALVGMHGLLRICISPCSHYSWWGVYLAKYDGKPDNQLLHTYYIAYCNGLTA